MSDWKPRLAFLLVVVMAIAIALEAAGVPGLSALLQHGWQHGW